jgi:DNA invertase Pin-like site-specific DNA recombinase
VSGKVSIMAATPVSILTLSVESPVAGSQVMAPSIERLPKVDRYRARSGASVFGRDGLMQLMDAARQRLFDVVIVEPLDRLSRDMEDLAGIHKRFSFQGIEIQAVHDGTVDEILIGIRGLVGQMQHEEGAKKLRYGMAGVVRDGRHAGGRAYGYRAVLGRPGQLEIVEEEASIVRRIFAAYAAGRRLAILLTISIAKVFVRHVASDGMLRPSTATRSEARD